MDSKTLAAIRSDYLRARLDEGDVAPDPYAQFGKWFDEALQSELPAQNAMTLATAGADGAPDARIVLLKGFDAGSGAGSEGFVFYTNYASRKGRELAENSRATLLFFWAELERQVRIEGTVTRVSAAESDEYFVSRPLGSRLGALASPQSEILHSRSILEARIEDMSARYGDNPPRPEHWGGYRVCPLAIEYWQGRPSRLHDRLRYRRASIGSPWVIERLAP